MTAVSGLAGADTGQIEQRTSNGSCGMHAFPRTRSLSAAVDGLGLTVSRKVSTKSATKESKKRTKPDPVPTPEQVRAARAALGISADELAELSGIAKSTILRYERRAGRAYAETLQMLRETLEAHGVDFVGRDGIKWSGS